MMRLADQSKVDSNAPVRRYLPEFAVADPTASAAVTVRQLFNHTSSWLGEDLQDFGRGDHAVTRFVASMTRLPQVATPTRRPCRTCCSIRYSLAPPTTSPTRSSPMNVAASHDVVDGKPVADTGFWAFPRGCKPDRFIEVKVREISYAKRGFSSATAQPPTAPDC
jgi:hypothetical protein